MQIVGSKVFQAQAPHRRPLHLAVHAIDNAVLEMVGQSLLFMWHSETPCGRTITHAWIHVQTDMRQRTNNTTETNTKRIRCSEENAHR